ncbi:MAG: methylamine utilization protein [Gammaproteobacteria bacterium]
MKRYLLIAFSNLIICLPSHAGTLAVTVTDSGGKALADVAVYVQPQGSLSTMPANKIQIEQKNKEFLPFVTVIQTGTSAYFPNRDGIGHHVYSFSQAKNFQLPLSEQETTDSVLFDKPGVVTVGCNIHDWMVAYIYVVDTPYFAVTDSSGAVNIDNVPAGGYTLHVWHPGSKAGTAMEQQINISDDGTLQLDFALDLKPEYFWKPARPTEHEESQY